MENSADLINSKTLKAFRERRGISQQQLAEAIGCAKDTVSRWECGKTQKVRSHLRKPLCKELRVNWEALTKPYAKPQDTWDSFKITVSIRKTVRTSLQLVAKRFNIHQNAILELAPLLFLIVAERSLLERRLRLQEINRVLAESEKKLLDNCAHLGGIVTAHSVSADAQLEEEEKSLDERDVFGRTIEYEFWHEGDEGPFVHYIRDLIKDLPKDAVTSIESFDADTIGSYQIADDTLRECTGISEDEKSGQDLLSYIRLGFIDFSECLRNKRNLDESDYHQWLSSELARAQEEAQHMLEDFVGDSESDASEKRNAP